MFMALMSMASMVSVTSQAYAQITETGRMPCLSPIIQRMQTAAN